MFSGLFHHTAGLTRVILPNLRDGMPVGGFLCRFDTIFTHAGLYS